jgi:cyclohexanone monooxygenase
MSEKSGKSQIQQLDAVIVGAGFAGLFMLHLLRDKLGLQAVAVETAGGVGGTWYWNRYPGARCDIPSHHYSYSFSEELQQEWTWSEKYAAQPEILAYLNHVAEKFDLLQDILFGTRVASAHFDDASHRWQVKTDDGRAFEARFFIPAVGNLSDANIPDFEGQDSFLGEVYMTARWPEEGVDFAGKRVGIIGTGATAIQAIPLIAEQAAHLTVFQRTANYATPLMNEPMDPAVDRQVKSGYRELRRHAWDSLAGVPFDGLKPSALADTPEERQAHYEACWQEGGFTMWLGSYADVLYDREANLTAADFVRDKIRQRVADPEVAEMLCPPVEQAYGARRQPGETGYFETYNRDNVTLVDISKSPINRLVAEGIRTEDGDYPVDILVYATGFDAFTGALFRIDIQGRNHKLLAAHWSAGPRTLYGISTSEFPNMFLITGPQSPSVLFNMPLGIEMHCEWIADCIAHLDRHGYQSIEPTPEAEEAWLEETARVANETLLPQTESWYSGANIPGKPRLFLVYLGGGKAYRDIISDCAARDYAGFIKESVAKQGAADTAAPRARTAPRPAERP